MSDLTKGYFRFYHGDESYEWAENRIEEIFDEDLDESWAVTLELINTAPSKQALGHIGAGYLEILVSRCGNDVIERIKEQAKHNNRLLYAMAILYLDEKNPIYNEFVSILKKRMDELGVYTDEDDWRLFDLPDKIK